MIRIGEYLAYNYPDKNHALLLLKIIQIWSQEHRKLKKITTNLYFLEFYHIIQMVLIFSKWSWRSVLMFTNSSREDHWYWQLVVSMKIWVIARDHKRASEDCVLARRSDENDWITLIVFKLFYYIFTTSVVVVQTAIYSWGASTFVILFLYSFSRALQNYIFVWEKHLC